MIRNLTRFRIQPKWTPLILCVPLGLLALALAYFVPRLPLLYWRVAGYSRTGAKAMEDTGIPMMLRVLGWAGWIVGALLLAAFVLGFFRRAWALRLVRKAYWALYVLGFLLAFVVFEVVDVFADNGIPVGEDMQQLSAVTSFYLKWHYLWPAVVIVALVWWLHVLSRGHEVATEYLGAAPVQTEGERQVNKILHGQERVLRRSMWASVTMHVFVIIILPWALQGGGCVEDYLVPGGSGGGGGGGGGAQAAVVKVQRAKQTKTKRKFVTRPNASIIFYNPSLDDSEVVKEVEKTTEMTYVADTSDVINRATGGTGSGSGTGSGQGIGTGGGKGGGWPEGAKNAVVRFIRLEYSGADWDDGMDSVSRADANFLTEFKKITGFKIAPNGESHGIALLRKYRPGYAPPFVYMTGSAGINVSQGEMKTLREYLLNGGMLFADCGSPQWDANFRSFAANLFPGDTLREIADDDPMFQMPFAFPNGAPPLWHHGGMRSMGIKHQGRWAIFYFPGDLNDAWKTGHSGLEGRLVVESYQLGVNIVYYAFTHYLEATRKFRK